MRCRVAQLCRTVCAATAPSLLAISVQAASFTGPVSPYYLDNQDTQQIFVVQGTSVINSFSWAYNTGNSAPYNEGVLAVTNVVTTNGFGSYYGSPATAGQYTLGGTPTGVGHVAQATPGFVSEIFFDGTSDGVHNYEVQFLAFDNSSHYTQNVIQTDLNWQNPVPLFSVQSDYDQWIGITYDPTNNSLWLSSFSGTSAHGSLISDYSLSGTLLSSFDTGQYFVSALALDHADNTLWVSNGQSNVLEQWSKSGRLLQVGIPNGLPDYAYHAGEFPIPEPASLALLGVGIAGLGMIWRRRA